MVEDTLKERASNMEPGTCNHATAFSLLEHSISVLEADLQPEASVSSGELRLEGHSICAHVCTDWHI